MTAGGVPGETGAAVYLYLAWTGSGASGECVDEESQGRNESRKARVARRATWAVIVSIVVGTLWLAGILVFWAFWSSGFDWFQNLIVVMASLIAAGGIIGAAWVSTGLSMYPK